MKYKDIKKILDKMSPEQLDQNVLYNSPGKCISGVVLALRKAKSDLYYTGEDDPVTLYTKTQLKDELSMDNDEIESCDIEIGKGHYYIEFN